MQAWLFVRERLVCLFLSTYSGNRHQLAQRFGAGCCEGRHRASAGPKCPAFFSLDVSVFPHHACRPTTMALSVHLQVPTLMSLNRQDREQRSRSCC